MRRSVSLWWVAIIGFVKRLKIRSIKGILRRAGVVRVDFWWRGEMVMSTVSASALLVLVLDVVVIGEGGLVCFAVSISGFVVLVVMLVPSDAGGRGERADGRTAFVFSSVEGNGVLGGVGGAREVGYESGIWKEGG